VKDFPKPKASTGANVVRQNKMKKEAAQLLEDQAGHSESDVHLLWGKLNRVLSKNDDLVNE